MSIKALIVDDEVDAQEVLEMLIERTVSNVEIVDKVSNLPDAVKAINKHQPNLVFLDVEMPDYSGYEIVNFFDKIDFHIIFVTAYDKYALNAFEINAVDYLLKPVIRTKLKEAVEKVELKLLKQHELNHYRKLVDDLTQKDTLNIVINEVGKKSILKIDEIIAIEAQGTYSKVHTLNSIKPIFISKNIGYFENKLTANNMFFRSHKSWLVNKKHILSFVKAKGQIDLSNNLKAKLSKYKKHEFELFVNKQ